MSAARYTSGELHDAYDDAMEALDDYKEYRLRAQTARTEGKNQRCLAYLILAKKCKDEYNRIMGDIHFVKYSAPCKSSV